MSQRVARTLGDLTSHGGCVVVQCQCRRTAIFSIHRLADLFKERRWPSEMRDVSARMRCTACGRRGVKAYYAQPPAPEMGRSLYMLVQAPFGICPVEWACGDERERKRMVQRIRG